MAIMREPKDVIVNGSKFVLSKFPCVPGRAILLQYPVSAMPKIGDYATNEELMFKIMSYVGVPDEKLGTLWLDKPVLVDQHVPTTETLLKLEWEMMQYNFNFFGNGGLSSILHRITDQVATSIQKILTDLLPRSSGKK